jgi:hypothetical protein
MKVQVKITNGDKEMCAVVNDVQPMQAQGVVDILREFFINLNALCNSETLK